MLSKSLLIISVTLLLAFGVLFFSTNPSYQKSLQARLNFLLSDYETSYELSKQAYELDKYNKMAFSILTKSKKALAYIEFNKLAQKYFDKINIISKQQSISKKDTNRIKFMCEIVLEEYKNLKPLEYENLKNQAKMNYKRFKEIHEKLF